MSKPNVVMFGNLAKQITETYEKKDTDYKGSYHESVERYGYVAGIVRMSDKFHRAENSLSEARKPSSMMRARSTHFWI